MKRHLTAYSIGKYMGSKESRHGALSGECIPDNAQTAFRTTEEGNNTT